METPRANVVRLTATLLCASLLAACSGQKPTEAPSDERRGQVGRVNLNLQTAGNRVDSISYVVRSTPNGTVVRSATVDIGPDAGNTTSWMLLPPGRYSVELASEAVRLAPPADGSATYPCVGSADFTVAANDTVQVSVPLTTYHP